MARVRKVHHSRQDHDGALRRLEQLGMSKGRHGSKAWFYVGTGLWTLRTVRRFADRREEILISEPLRPGDRIIISNNRATLEAPVATAKPPKGRRARKAQRKADEKAAKIAAKQEAKLRAKAAKRQARKAKTVAPVDAAGVD